MSSDHPRARTTPRPIPTTRTCPWLSTDCHSAQEHIARKSNPSIWPPHWRRCLASTLPPTPWAACLPRRLPQRITQTTLRDLLTLLLPTKGRSDLILRKRRQVSP